VQQGIFWPMGRSTPVVQTDGARKAPASSVTVKIDTLAELADLRALLTGAGVLLLNVPPSANVGVDTAYIAVGKVTNRRVTDIGADPYRAVELPYQVVDMPIGGSQSSRTYADLFSFTTYAQLSAAYTSLLLALSGRVPETRRPIHRPAGRPVTARVNSPRAAPAARPSPPPTPAAPRATPGIRSTSRPGRRSRSPRRRPTRARGATGSRRARTPVTGRTCAGRWPAGRWSGRGSTCGSRRCPRSETQLTYVSSSGSSRLLTRVSLTTSGRFKVLDASFNGVWTATSSLSLNTWYRVELDRRPGHDGTNGTIRFAYAAADGAAAESFASTSANTGTGGSLGTVLRREARRHLERQPRPRRPRRRRQSSTTFLGASAASGTPVVVDPTPPPGAVVVDRARTCTGRRSGRRSRSVVGVGDVRRGPGGRRDRPRPGGRQHHRHQQAGCAPGAERGPGPAAGGVGGCAVRPAGAGRHAADRRRARGDHRRHRRRRPDGRVRDRHGEAVRGDRKVVVTAPDKWVRVQRSKFLQPRRRRRGRGCPIRRRR
jgi:hypothetical protein